jgi:ferredoxin
MKRLVIKIDESKCNGCGSCVNACAEGALQLVNGKARLVREDHCDGLGVCIGDCPTGALTLETREVAPQIKKAAAAPPVAAEPVSACAFAGRLPARGQWPVQLHLVRPGAPFFSGRELLVLSTCAPVAAADAHASYMAGRSVVVACPKLDRTEGYVEKLAAILQDESIPGVVVLRMEVPCCGGLTRLARAALQQSGRTGLKAEEITLALDGSLQSRSAIVYQT